MTCTIYILTPIAVFLLLGAEIVAVDNMPDAYLDEKVANLIISVADLMF